MQNGATTVSASSAPASSTFPWRYLALFLAIFGLLLAADEPIYRVLHEHYNYHTRPVPDQLKLATRILRSMENWGENVFIVAIGIAIWQLDCQRRSRILCLVLASVLVTLVVEGVKRVTGRERPEVCAGKLRVHGPAAWNKGGDFQSFPSGHTASAAAYSGSLAAFYPPLRPVFVALAVGCAGNRIWKERHFASDCWVGGVLGFWLAFTLPRRRRVQPLLNWFDRCFSVPPAPVAETPRALPAAA